MGNNGGGSVCTAREGTATWKNANEIAQVKIFSRGTATPWSLVTRLLIVLTLSVSSSVRVRASNCDGRLSYNVRPKSGKRISVFSRTFHSSVIHNVVALLALHR